MSLYAYFACEKCKEYLWLGKVIRDAEGSVERFAAATDQGVPNSAQPLRTRALWKMLAEHRGHSMRVYVEDELEQALGDGLREIGGDGEGDIPFDEYLAGFKG